MNHNCYAIVTIETEISIEELNNDWYRQTKSVHMADCITY